MSAGCREKGRGGQMLTYSHKEVPSLGVPTTVMTALHTVLPLRLQGEPTSFIQTPRFPLHGRGSGGDG